MEGFAALPDAALGPRYRAYGFNGSPLTAQLSDISFCVWAIATQLPHLCWSEAQNLLRAFYSAGLANAMDDAFAYVKRSTAPRPLSVCTDAAARTL